ncbi:hypothetical protein Cgig2_011024 [Carnegiea gigantea]|uniref:Phytocyanin domain-containing protein n=1 Tax=Carnegiea gigantea TaxID=171969 RepID=A0A9Q1QI75_9CARY|nr:hypothetical protein Cgig2_011024 [Carnegiea gigantea]
MAAAKVVAAAVTAVLLVVALPPPAAHAAVYKVGDAAGWTTIGNVDYKQWAATKTFHVGDVIVFNYAPQFHNVMQVTHQDYKACNASSPIVTHTSGNDSITITKHGHHFFLCGVPGHCQSGQKVDINVRRTATTTASAMAPSPSHESVASTPAKAAASAMAPGPSSDAPAYSAPLECLFISVVTAALVASLLV